VTQEISTTGGQKKQQQNTMTRHNIRTLQHDRYQLRGRSVDTTAEHYDTTDINHGRSVAVDLTTVYHAAPFQPLKPVDTTSEHHSSTTNRYKLESSTYIRL